MYFIDVIYVVYVVCVYIYGYICMLCVCTSIFLFQKNIYNGLYVMEKQKHELKMRQTKTEKQIKIK